MMHRFSQILSRPVRRQSVDRLKEVGSTSTETLRHDASPRQVKEKQRTCSQVDKTSGDVSRTDPVTDVIAEWPPAGEYGVASFSEESCVHSNANNAYAGGWATTSVTATESKKGNDDVSFVVDKWLSNNDLDSDTTTGQEDFGTVGVNSVGGESSDELCHANLYRWSSVDLAYDADIDEMPCADEQTAAPVKDFSQAANGGHSGSGPDTDATYSVEGKPSVDFVGANVVGDNFVGANVVGAYVVGDKLRGVSDVPRSDRKSSVHPNVNNANLERWETPYNSDTDPWDDYSYDEPEANVDLDSNAIDQEDGATTAVTSVGGGPPYQVEPPSTLNGLLVVDLEYAGEIPCDGQTTVFSIGVSDVVDIRYMSALKSDDVDAVGENPGGVDAVSRESAELTSVSQVSADQYSANDDWCPAFVSDPEQLEDIGESDQLVLQESSASGVSFGSQSSVLQANVVGVNEKQPGVQSNIVSVNERPYVHSNVADVNAKPYAPSYVFNFDRLPSDQSRTATPHTHTTVFISDAETDDENFAADAVPTSTSTVNETPPDECSRFAANADAEEKVDPVETTVDLTTTTVKESPAVGDHLLPDVKVEKVQSEMVRIGAALFGAARDDWALPVVDDNPVTWVKSGDDFDWDDASSDIDTKPPYRLVCGCFPKRRRRLTIQLRRYRVKRVAKKKKKEEEGKEEVEEGRTEQEPKDENFVEIKCPRGQSSFKGFFRSR